MERLSAPERTREEVRALMKGELGRKRDERGEGEKAGYRNGYRQGKVKTAEGAVY
jgi:hypothetical protein